MEGLEKKDIKVYRPEGSTFESVVIVVKVNGMGWSKDIKGFNEGITKTETLPKDFGHCKGRDTKTTVKRYHTCGAKRELDNVINLKDRYRERDGSDKR